MTRNKVVFLKRLLWGLCALLAIPDIGLAVQCPGPDGAQIKVCIYNPLTTTPTVTLAGDVVTGLNTCTSALSSFSTTRTFTLTQNTECFDAVPTDGGPANDLLQTGLWVMRISYNTTVNGAGGTNLTQYQKVSVVFNNDFPIPNPNRTVVNWTYFPNVFSVNSAADGAISACTSNCLNGCTLRHAMKCANDTSTSTTKPVLVRFGIAAQTISMNNSAALTIAGNGRIAIDGTNSSGNPWVVGDFKAAQDAFSWVVDLNNTTNFEITSSNDTIQGLHIKNTHAANVAQAANLIHVDSGTDTVLRSLRLDGGNNCSSGQCACSGSGNCPDLIKADAGVSYSSPGVTVRNVEGLSGLDQGMESTDNGYAFVKDSWLHNNLGGGARSSATGKLKAERNMVELSGRVSGASGAPFNISADGLSSLGQLSGTSELQTDANISRLNTNNGLTVKDAGTPTLAATNDYSCGNTAQGFGINIPATASGQGYAGVYHTNKAVTITGSGSATLDFGGNGTSVGKNAFARNSATCDFSNTVSGLTVKAQNDQWTGGTPLTCGNGTVDTGTPQDYVTVPIDVNNSIPTVPSNVFLKNQTVRIRGSGFNAVDANPAPNSGPDCVKGNPDPPYTSGSTTPCCTLKPAAANICDTGTNNPFHNGTQCVQFRDGQGTWQKVTAVSSVTPTTIVVAVPAGNGGGIPCMGAQWNAQTLQNDKIEKVHVSKWDYTNSKISEDEGDWCTTGAQKDIF